jgi:hypothetical protein
VCKQVQFVPVIFEPPCIYRVARTLKMCSKKQYSLCCLGGLIAMCSDIYTEHINALCAQNVYFCVILDLVVHVVTTLL